jgi:protein TonB
MPQDLFSEITTPRARAPRGSSSTIAASIAAHVIVIAALVIAPLLAMDGLPVPSERLEAFVVAEVPPPPPPPPPPIPRDPRLVAATTADRSYPTDAPDGVHDELSRTPDVPRVPGGVSGEATEGALFGLGTRTIVNGPAPPPPPPVKPVPVGGRIREPQKVFSVAPVYPAIARTAGISGTVVLQAVIGVDGSITDLRVASGIPLLDQAALDAVRRWRYRPTLLNGVPVPIVMTVAVRFTLE